MKAAIGFAMPHERRLILLICAIAAVRVLLFSAAFPFFNNVDEQAHVDLVMKYGRGEVPRDLGHYSSESVYYISLYGTPEYFMGPQQFETGLSLWERREHFTGGLYDVPKPGTILQHRAGISIKTLTLLIQ